jgi:hypothetical protein
MTTTFKLFNTTLATYKKVGGLHFVTVFRLGFSFYIAKKQRQIIDKIG